jgi:hypothetical protein
MYHVCVPCFIYDLNIPNCRYYSQLHVYALYIYCGMVDLFVLFILVDNPGISFGKCHFFLIDLFVSGIALCFVLCFVFGMLRCFNLCFFKEFCNFPYFFAVMCEKVAHFVFWCCESVFTFCSCVLLYSLLL